MARPERGDLDTRSLKVPDGLISAAGAPDKPPAEHRSQPAKRRGAEGGKPAGRGAEPGQRNGVQAGEQGQPAPRRRAAPGPRPRQRDDITEEQQDRCLPRPPPRLRSCPALGTGGLLAPQEVEAPEAKDSLFHRVSSGFAQALQLVCANKHCLDVRTIQLQKLSGWS